MWDDCVIWAGKTTPEGYGYYTEGGKTVYAHRVALAEVIGPIPPGMWALHRCDTPQCVNPDHLFAGSPGDNTRDRDNKGRQARGERSGNATLTEADVIAIHDSQGTQESVARVYGVNRATVSNIRNEKTWRHLWSEVPPPDAKPERVAIDIAALPIERLRFPPERARRYKAKNLRTVMKDEGRKLSWLAGRVEVTRQYMEQVANRKRGISKERALLICEILGQPLDSLFEPY